MSGEVYLIDAGANINIKDDKGQTPLHKACISENQEMVKLLIQKGADLEIKDNDGDTALLIASLFNDLSIVVNLIDAGANIDAQNNDRQTVDYILNHNLEIDHRGRQIVLTKLLQLRLQQSYNTHELDGGKKRRKTIKKSKRKKKSKKKKKSKRKYK
jgi:ankyrin repeat protein